MKQRTTILLLLLLLLGGAFFYMQKQAHKQTPETADTPQAAEIQQLPDTPDTALPAVPKIKLDAAQLKAATVQQPVPTSSQTEMANKTDFTDVLDDNTEDLRTPLDENLLDTTSLFYLKAQHLQAVQNVRETKEILSPSAPR